MNKALTAQLANPQAKGGVNALELGSSVDKMRLDEVEQQNQKLKSQKQLLEEKVTELESMLEVANMRGSEKVLGESEEAKLKESLQKVTCRHKHLILIIYAVHKKKACGVVFVVDKKESRERRE